MRLIDADKLLNKIDAYMCGSQDVMFVKELIKEQPTAFNVDKVVVKLEAQSEMNLKKGFIEVLPDEARPYLKAVESFDKAIEIIKAGGIDDL